MNVAEVYDSRSRTLLLNVVLLEVEAEDVYSENLNSLLLEKHSARVCFCNHWISIYVSLWHEKIKTVKQFSG